jgi:hypothetical protein
VIDNNNNVVDLDGPRLAPTPPPPPAPAVKEDSSSNFYFGSTDHGDGADSAIGLIAFDRSFFIFRLLVFILQTLYKFDRNPTYFVQIQILTALRFGVFGVCNLSPN